MTHANYPDPEWRLSVLHLLAALNAAFGYPSYSVLMATLGENDLSKIGAALAGGAYRPQDWFQPGSGSGDPVLIGNKPPIDPAAEFRLLHLTALKEVAGRASIQFRGILFEDPFYAILACFNIGTHHRLLILPKVSSVDQAWQQRETILRSLMNGVYAPQRYFFECAPVGQNTTGLPMTSILVKGNALEQLRQTGENSVQDSLGFSRYALYDFVPPE